MGLEYSYLVLSHGELAVTTWQWRVVLDPGETALYFVRFLIFSLMNFHQRRLRLKVS